jgi:DNA primase
MTKIDKNFIDLLVKTVRIEEYMESEYDSYFIYNRTTNWGNTNCPMPYHADSSPSFGVNTNDNLYNCFGCGAKGNVINLVQAVEGLTFVETIQKLANFANIDIELVNLDIKTLIRDLNNSINRYFELENTSRYPGGLSEVGFLIAFSHRTKKYLRKNNFDEKDMQWIDSVYQDLENKINSNDFKGINDLWKKLSDMMRSKHHA